MAKNGIYTRGFISKSGVQFTCDLEIYRRKDSKVYHKEAVYRGDLSTEDVWDLAKKDMLPGEALLGVNITSRNNAVFEMSKKEFYQTANCRLV